MVLVDEAAEPVATADFACGRSCSSLVGFGCPLLEGTMRPVGWCTYSIFLQIDRIRYAAEFVHPTRRRVVLLVRSAYPPRSRYRGGKAPAAL